MVISSYGAGAHPLISSGGSDGFDVAGAAPYSHIALIGIDFQGPGATGIWLDCPGTDYLIENCVVQGYGDNIDVMTAAPNTGQAQMSNVTIRRSVIKYSNGQGKSQGMYAYGVVNLKLDGNVFYHNGWSDDGTTVPLSIRSHDAYTDATTNLVATNNIFADASSFGLTVSADNTGDTTNPDIENNLFAGDTNSLTFGAGGPNAISGGIVRGNVFTQIGRSIGGSPQAYGIDLGSSSNMLIEGNLFFNNPEGGTTFLVHLGDRNGYSNITIRNNVANNWNGGFIWIAGANYQNVSITGNIIQDSAYGTQGIVTIAAPDPQVVFSNNTYYTTAPTNKWFTSDGGTTFETLAQWAAATGETGATAGPAQFVNPNATVGSYAASIGVGTTMEDFLRATLAQSKTNWQTQLTAQSILSYLKAGFSLVGGTSSPSTTAPATSQP
jgi:hypothetical protein